MGQGISSVAAVPGLWYSVGRSQRPDLCHSKQLHEPVTLSFLRVDSPGPYCLALSPV